MAVQTPVFIMVFLFSVGLFTSNAQNKTCSFTTIFIEGGENCPYCNTNVTVQTNTTTCVASVMSIDFSPPSITCPDDIVVESSIDDSLLPVNWEVPANATGVVTSTHQPNDMFPVEQTTTVFYLATRNMMTAICNFTVTVERPTMGTDSITTAPMINGSTMQPDITAESVPVSCKGSDHERQPENDLELVLALTTVVGFTLWIITLVIVSLVCWCQRCPPQCILGDNASKEIQEPPPIRLPPRLLPNGNTQVDAGIYGNPRPSHKYDNAPPGVRLRDLEEEVASVHSEGQIDLPAGGSEEMVLPPLGPEERPPVSSTGNRHQIPPNTVLGMRRPDVPGKDGNNGSSDLAQNDDNANSLYDIPVTPADLF